MADKKEVRFLLDTPDAAGVDSNNRQSSNHELYTNDSDNDGSSDQACDDCEITHEDLWFDPELFSHVHSHSGTAGCILHSMSRDVFRRHRRRNGTHDRY